jgi:hypothetical protein
VPNVYLLHGTLGLLDEGFFLVAIVLMAAALLAFAGSLIKQGGQQS